MDLTIGFWRPFIWIFIYNLPCFGDRSIEGINLLYLSCTQRPYENFIFCQKNDSFFWLCVVVLPLTDFKLLIVCYPPVTPSQSWLQIEEAANNQRKPLATLQPAAARSFKPLPPTHLCLVRATTTPLLHHLHRATPLGSHWHATRGANFFSPRPFDRRLVFSL